jgi:S1-C subfamily serine protease
MRQSIRVILAVRLLILEGSGRCNRAIQTTNVSISGEPLNSGIGFAVSSNLIKRVLPHLIAKGKYDYPYLGLEGLPELTLEAQKELNLPQANGVFVTRVANGGPAQKAGIRRGDLVVAIDNQVVNSFSELISISDIE